MSFLVYLLVFLSIDTNIIGYQKGIFDYQRTLIPNLFAFFVIINVLIFGGLFAVNSLKSKDPVIQIKSKFLIIALVTSVAATIIDTIFVGPYLILRITIRMILIISSIEYYLGFILPERLVNLFIRGH